MSPVISFDEKSFLRGKVLPPAWYRLRVDAVGEKPAKNGESTNYPVEAVVIRNAEDGSEEFAGVPVDWNFNSKAISFAMGYLASMGIDVKPGTRYDLSATAGKEIEVFVENDLWEGRTINRVNHKYRAAQ